MSSIHEESLLSDALSMEDLTDDAISPVSGLLYQQPCEKFGIINTNENSNDKDLTNDQSNGKSNVDVASLCSSMSSVSMHGEGASRHQALSPHGTSSHIHSSSSEHKDASDSEVFHHYSTWEDERERMCLVGTTSDSSFGSLSRPHGRSSRSTSQSGGGKLPSTTQPPTSLEWVTFDEAKSPKINDSSPSYAPDIPNRRMLQSSETSSGVDLLSMDPDTLNEHLVKGTNTVNSDVPPIPDRVMSPQRIVSSSTPCQSPVPPAFDYRIPPPPSSSNNSSFKRQVRSRSSVGTPSRSIAAINPPAPTLGPPIPPRKDIAKPVHVRSVSETSSSSLHGWMKFDPKASSKDDLIENDHYLPDADEKQQLQVVENVDSSTSSLSVLGTSAISTSDTFKEPESEDSMWTTNSPPSSPKSSKKKKRGYQHLSSGSEEEAKSEAKGDEVTIQVTDSSPVKPLSRWQPIPNEAGESPADVSGRNSVGDGEIHDDLDADDVFNVNLNRLSADMSDLKGFNRADKGSQNNLVDFSYPAEKSGRSSEGDEEDSENELETVFDMTAQGDSLKRRRKKKSSSSDGVVRESPSVVYPSDDTIIGCVATDTAALSTDDEFHKNEVKVSDPSTNPFCRTSPSGDAVSLTSSTNESNPFDRIQFQPTIAPIPPTTGPAPTAATAATPTPAPKHLASDIPVLPPPPKSSKSRAISGSFGRRRAPPVSSPQHPSKGGIEPDGSDRRSERLSSVEVVRPPSVTHSPLLPDNMGLLEGRNSSSSNNISLSDAASTSLFPHKDELKPDNDIMPGSSGKDATILEKTLSIVDVFSKSPELEIPPITIESSDVKTCQALQMSPAYPDLRESSFDSLEKLQKAMSVESPDAVTGGNLDVKSLKAAVQSNPASGATEWRMLMRFPREKRMMSSRKWVEIVVRLKSDNARHPALQLYHNEKTRDPFFFIELDKHDWTLSPTTQRHRFDDSRAVEEEVKRLQRVGPLRAHSIKDKYHSFKQKVHVVKILETRYKEKRSFVSKRDKYVTRTPQGFKHSLRAKPVLKLGTGSYEDLLSLLFAINDAAFNANRGMPREDYDHKPTVKFHSRDEMIIHLHDQFTGVVAANGAIEECDVTVHVYATSFLSGDPVATVTFNDKKVEGNEVARRKDIIPSSNDCWVGMSDIEVHRCSPRGYEGQSSAITFYPPDACRFQLARFRCPYTDVEPPIALRAAVVVNGTKVTLRCALRSCAAHRANKDQLTQVPCEELAIRFPIPESWTDAFLKRGLVNLHSVRSERAARLRSNRARRGGGAVLGNAAMVASVGRAKFELAHQAVVWRVGRFPEKNAAQNTPQVFTCDLHLQSEAALSLDGDTSRYRKIDVEYRMPSATASYACVRSISLPNSSRAEKFTSYDACYMYSVGVNFMLNQSSGTTSTPNCAVQ